MVRRNRLFLYTYTVIGVLAMAASIQSSENECQNKDLLLGFSDPDKWHVSADKPWWELVDMRDMLNLSNP